MAYDRTPYKCPKCGKWCTGAISFRKHVDSDACKREQRKQNKEKQ